MRFNQLWIAVASATLGAAPRAVHAQVDAGRVIIDEATSAPILTYSNACSAGRFGVDYGVNQACFYEKPQYKGKCVCVGPRPTRNVVGAFRLESSEVGSVRVASRLAVNIVLDEYKHEIKSLLHDCPQREPVNYIVVSREDAVCAFQEANYFGRKYCLSAENDMDEQIHTIPFAFQSLMVLPDTDARIKAEIRRGKFVTRSAALPSEMENGGAPAYNGSEGFSFDDLEDEAKDHMPYTKLRLAYSD